MVCFTFRCQVLTHLRKFLIGSGTPRKLHKLYSRVSKRLIGQTQPYLHAAPWYKPRRAAAQLSKRVSRSVHIVVATFIPALEIWSLQR